MILQKQKEYSGSHNAVVRFGYRFVDRLIIAAQFDNRQHTKTMAGLLFATLAIFILCLGLFGLSAYVAESRVKEIGRKVLSASVVNIGRNCCRSVL